MLPMHPLPENDELLSSWMVRLAFANGYSLHTFYNKVLGYTTPIWNRDTDRRPGDDLILMLGRQTGQRASMVRALSLMYYEGTLFSQVTPVGNTPWILPVGVFHRERRHAGMQYCSACLRSDQTIYYRRYWRLAHYVVCHRHACPMADKCPMCATPVAFHRHGIGRRKLREPDDLAFCSSCGADLRLAPRMDAALARMIGYIDAVDPIELTRWQVSMNMPCALPLFQGMHCLISVLIGRNGAKLRKDVYACTGLDIEVDSRSEFEQLCLAQRLPLVLAVWWLMGQWPARFLSLSSAAGLTRSRMCEVPSMLPFWVATVVDEFLDRKVPLPCEEEVLSACVLLKRRGKKVTSRRLAAFMGISIGYASYARQLWEKQIQTSISLQK
jgi:hypothetical protein